MVVEFGSMRSTRWNPCPWRRSACSVEAGIPITSLHSSCEHGRGWDRDLLEGIVVSDASRRSVLESRRRDLVGEMLSTTASVPPAPARAGLGHEG